MINFFSKTVVPWQGANTEAQTGDWQPQSPRTAITAYAAILNLICSPFRGDDVEACARPAASKMPELCNENATTFAGVQPKMRRDVRLS
jgi:hypothetical protein